MAGCAAAVAPLGAGIGPAAAVFGANDKAPEVILMGEVGAEGVPLDDIVVVWDEIIDASSMPSTNDFRITINLIDYEPVAVEFLLAGLASSSVVNADGLSFVKLQLPPGVTWSNEDTVLLDYTGSAIRDLGLGVAEGFTDFQPFAWDTGDDFGTIDPIVDSYYGADHMVLTFLHQIAPGPLPDFDDFTVEVDGVPNAVVSVTHVHQDVGLGLLDLELADPVTDPNAVVTLHYEPDSNLIVSARSGATAGVIDAQAILILAQTAASDTIAPTGTVSTAGPDGPTVADPTFVSLTSPVGGAVTLEEVTITEDPPAGWGFFGFQFNITADPASDEAHPLVLTFGIDASIIPAGTLVMFKDGAEVLDCNGAGVADPDPCISARSPLPDGDVGITVLTTTASGWNVAIRLPFAFGGFMQPVDGAVPNILQAGRAVPVKFSLGGDRGLDIFEAGSPSVIRLESCAGLPTGDPVEQTVTAGGSSLSYHAATDTYTYVWKTLKSWADTCRRLELSFADGSSASTIFEFLK
ncbi:MAG: PxKF domain-containing protein [Chloroflexota bacterium]